MIIISTKIDVQSPIYIYISINMYTYHKQRSDENVLYAIRQRARYSECVPVMHIDNVFFSFTK